MKLHHLLLVFTIIASVQSATLRQYSRDWLIAAETSLHKEPKRITAKSVFIAPDFSAVRCAQGYREDDNGNCVKLVRVSQTAQLDFLLQKLNAMYGSPGSSSGSLPFGGPKPLNGPGQVAPYDGPKPQGATVGNDNVKLPKPEPCIELPMAEDPSTISTSPSTTSSTTLAPTSLSSAETLSVSASVQEVVSNTEMPASTEVTLAVTTEGSLEKDPEVVLVGNGSDMVVNVVKGNGTSVVENEHVLDTNDSVSGVKTVSVNNLLIEVNDQAVGVTGDVINVVKDGENLTSPTKFNEIESTTEGSYSETVLSNAFEKDKVVDVAEDVTTEISEITTVVDEAENTSTEDYSDEFPVEPEMGSGESDNEQVENISADNLFSETANANLDAMLEQNNSSQVDKVLPVRNIIPEASSERIQFVDSPIINIQPVRNSFPGDDEIMEVDLKPNANGASLQVHNLNPSKLVPPKFMEEHIKPIPEAPFSLDEYLNRQPVPPIPVYRPYENLNFNPQQQHFPLHYQQPVFPPRSGFVRFPDERDQVFQVDQRVNSVRFPPGEQFNDEKLRQWASNWSQDNRRVQRPVMRFWNKMPLIRNPEEGNQRYQQDRRRPPPQYYQ